MQRTHMAWNYRLTRGNESWAIGVCMAVLERFGRVGSSSDLLIQPVFS